MKKPSCTTHVAQMYHHFLISVLSRNEKTERTGDSFSRRKTNKFILFDPAYLKLSASNVCSEEDFRGGLVKITETTILVAYAFPCSCQLPLCHLPAKMSASFDVHCRFPILGWQPFLIRLRITARGFAYIYNYYQSHRFFHKQ